VPAEQPARQSGTAEWVAMRGEDGRRTHRQPPGDRSNAGSPP
jgi:peptide-N4-(N-acetyl-beta-glucosaminyl)asparagine amidase